jgi:hypothetical protein
MRGHQNWVNKPRDEKQRAEQTILLFALGNEPTCAMHRIIVLSLQSDSFYRSKRCGKTKMRLLQTHAKGTGTTIATGLQKRVLFFLQIESIVSIQKFQISLVGDVDIFHIWITHKNKIQKV